MKDKYKGHPISWTEWIRTGLLRVECPEWSQTFWVISVIFGKLTLAIDSSKDYQLILEWLKSMHNIFSTEFPQTSWGQFISNHETLSRLDGLLKNHDFG
jgi:hypothetical protein